MINTPPFAVAQAAKEIHRMAMLARDNFVKAANDLIQGKADNYDEIEHVEEGINYLNHGITPMLVKINALELSYQDAKYIGRAFHVINDIERIGDHAENLAQAAKARQEENIELSPEAISELQEMFDTTLELLDGAIEVFTEQNLDKETALRLNKLESSIDDMQTGFEQSHIERLNTHACTTQGGMLFINTVTDFERVGDHATNIAWKVSHKPTI
jgi:phosphate:Na+ symporter